MTVEAHGVSLATNANGQNGFKGEKITVGSTSIVLTKVTKANNTSSTSTCYVYASNGSTLLATGGAWSGNDSSFNYTLSANTTYYIGVTVSNQTLGYNSSPSYPYNGTYISWVSGRGDGVDESNRVWSIESITVTLADVTVNPSTLTLSTTSTSPTYIVEAPPLTLNSSVTTLTPTFENTLNVSAVGLTATAQDPSYYTSSPSAVVVGTGTVGTKYIRTDYPYEEGLTAGTTKGHG